LPRCRPSRSRGIPFAERFGSLFRGLTQGAEGSDKRQALDNTLVALENRLGHMMAMYDVADAPSGLIGKMEGIFFKLTGVSSVIDNQRGDAEAMFASHIGGKRDQAWADIGPKEQRVLQGFGIGEAEWKALHGVEWTKVGDKTYLFPNDALKLSDDQVKAYIDEARPMGQGLTAGPEDIAKAREDLALQIATTYTDRAVLRRADARRPRSRHAVRQELPAGNADQYRVAFAVPVQDLAGRHGHPCLGARDLRHHRRRQV
jgi:hypothetical protein